MIYGTYLLITIVFTDIHGLQNKPTFIYPEAVGKSEMDLVLW